MRILGVMDIVDRVSRAKRVLAGVLPASGLLRAKLLFCEAQKGPYVSPVFYFELAVACLRESGLELGVRDQCVIGF